MWWPWNEWCRESWWCFICRDEHTPGVYEPFIWTWWRGGIFQETGSTDWLSTHLESSSGASNTSEQVKCKASFLFNLLTDLWIQNKKTTIFISTLALWQNKSTIRSFSNNEGTAKAMKMSLALSVKCRWNFPELNSWRPHSSLESVWKICRGVFMFCIKRLIRTFHVLVVQWRQRNVPKSVMHVQSCYFGC